MAGRSRFARRGEPRRGLDAGEALRDQAADHRGEIMPLSHRRVRRDPRGIKESRDLPVRLVRTSESADGLDRQAGALSDETARARAGAIVAAGAVIAETGEDQARGLVDSRMGEEALLTAIAINLLDLRRAWTIGPGHRQ